MRTSKSGNIDSSAHTGQDSLLPSCLKRCYDTGLSEFDDYCTHSCNGWPYTYQWTVADHCCYDTFQRKPQCCSSESYRLVITLVPAFVTFIILVPLFIIACCWYFNWIPGLVRILTCGVIKMKRKRKKSRRKTAKTSPDLCMEEDSVSVTTTPLSNTDVEPQRETKNVAVNRRTANVTFQEDDKIIDRCYTLGDFIEPKLPSYTDIEGIASNHYDESSGTLV